MTSPPRSTPTGPAAPADTTQQAAPTGWGLLRRELHQRRHALVPVLGWSTVEALPALLSGWLVAMAADQGFLAGKPWVGAAWLAAFAACQLVRTLGTRGLLPRLADIVEPVRDALVTRVVNGALQRAVQGGDRPDTSALARLTEQVQSVRGLISALLLEVRRIGIALVTAGIGLATLSLPLAGLALAPVLLSLVLFSWLQRRLKARQLAVIVADEMIASDAIEVLNGMRDVVACGAQDRVAATLGAAIDAQARSERRLATAEATRLLVIAIAEGLPLIAVLVATPWLISTQHLGVGEVLGAITYVVSGLQPAVSSLLGALSGFGLQLGVTLERIAQTSAVPPRPARTGVTPTRFTLDAQQVTFAYGPHALPVIRDLSLAVAEGEHLAIVGPSGIGKSTLVDMLTGITHAQRGTVALGGVPLRDVDDAHLRRRVALIPQESYVFAGTLGDNLRYLAPDAAGADLDRAVDAVGLRELRGRVGGYDTELDVRGDALGVADRQLIALARVHLSPADVVILDEGTCFLDPVAEETAERAFRERPGTLIVVAHRMSSARRAHRILVMDGETAIAGTHESLLADSALYRELTGHWTDSAAQPAPVAASRPRTIPKPAAVPTPRWQPPQERPWRSRPVHRVNGPDHATVRVPLRPAGRVGNDQPTVLVPVGPAGMPARPHVGTGLPGPRSAELLARQRRREPDAPAYPPHAPFAVAAAAGSHVRDLDGNVFIDFRAPALGHRHPELLAAAVEQPAAARSAFTDAQLSMLPAGLRDRMLIRLCPGQSPVDVAVALCRSATGRRDVVSLPPIWRADRVEFLDATLRDPDRAPAAPAAILIELRPVGAARAESVQRLRALTRELGIPLVVDETHTGGGRTGSWFAFEQYDIEPDVIIAPDAVLIYDEKLPAGTPTGSGRSPQLALAIGAKTVEVIRRDDLLRNVVARGEQIAARLAGLAAHPGVREVRGRGLLWDIELPDPELARQVQARALRTGLIVELDRPGERTVRLLPAFTVTAEVVDIACSILLHAIEGAHLDGAARADRRRPESGQLSPAPGSGDHGPMVVGRSSGTTICP